jgi:predicted helicase
LTGQDESAFVKVLDNTFIRAAKRLYMTATPGIPDDASKGQDRSGSGGPYLDG